MANDRLKTATNAKSIIEEARRAKGWNVDSEQPLREAGKIINPNGDWERRTRYGIAGVNQASWNGFLYGKRTVSANIYKAYAQILGLNWENIVEKNNVNDNDDFTHDPPVKVDPDDPNFVGREEAIEEINQRINQNSNTRICQIIAPPGQGKTTLAKKYLESKKFEIVLELIMPQKKEDIASAKSWLEQKLRQLGQEPQQEFMLSLDQLKQRLQTQRIGILIENLETALDREGKFIEQHRSYVDLLKALSNYRSLQSLTLITTREPLKESDINNIEDYDLKGLTLDAWEKYFLFQKIRINPENNTLKDIRNAYGGNAKAMDIISKVITNPEDYNHDLERYWSENKGHLLINGKLEDLIKKQFDRLEQLKLDNAYNLLCRLGCYRYQDVPTISEAGLKCLLWDVKENKHKKKVINVLKERALVEFNKDLVEFDQDQKYWLHPVIREEAINRLTPSENLTPNENLRRIKDWETANTKAAEFWTASVKTVETVKDAITAFEAYYHHFNIDDYENMINVLFFCREKSSCQQENLRGGVSLFDDFRRLGLLSKIESFKQILDREKELKLPNKSVIQPTFRIF